MSQFDNVSVIKRANVYADGQCVSHTVLLPDGTRKTLGVMLPGTLTFSTAAPEIIDVNAGICRVRIGVSTEWQRYSAGDSFCLPGDSQFEIEVTELLDYVCHFG